MNLIRLNNKRNR